VETEMQLVPLEMVVRVLHHLLVVLLWDTLVAVEVGLITTLLPVEQQQMAGALVVQLQLRVL
jgi:hypothetical protein